MSFFQPYIYAIILSFLVSLVVYFKPSPYYLRFFPPFLFITAGVESYAAYLQSVGKHNITIYNFFTVFEFAFYLLVIALITGDKQWKKIIFISIPVYVIIACGNIFFVIEKNSLHSITYCLGCLLIVIFCIHYFLELFRLPKWSKLSNNPAVWICSGLLFFYCCGFPFFGLMNYWGQTPGGYVFLVKYYLPISNILNVALYTLFAIAFLCNRTRKYTLSSS